MLILFHSVRGHVRLSVIGVVKKATETGRESELCGPFCGCQLTVVQHSSELAGGSSSVALGVRISFPKCSCEIITINKRVKALLRVSLINE